MRYGKLTRRVTVAVVLLLGLVTVGDIVALQVAQSMAATGVAQVTAAEGASVDLGGFPFLPRLASGSIPEAQIDATGLAGAGLRVATLSVRVSDVRFATRPAIGIIRSPFREKTPVMGSNPIGQAQINERDLNEYLRRRITDFWEIRVRPTGVEVRLRSPDGGPTEPIRFLPRIEERRFVLRVVAISDVPAGLLERVRDIERMVELPVIPQGLRVDISLGHEAITVEASGPEIELLVGEGGLSPVPDD